LTGRGNSTGFSRQAKACRGAAASPPPAIFSILARRRGPPLRERAMKAIFVMVKCALGRAYAVADEAVNLEHVSEVWSISGQYDLLLKFYLPDALDIGHFVTERVQTLPEVKDTFTIIAFKAFTEGPPP
jgi:DNA-binding Lrp family transcriptional regulator